MFLQEIYAENFRVFGSASDGGTLNLVLQKGINVLVGENDGGKSAILDVIRICLHTTSNERHWFNEDDFHCAADGRAQELTLRCKFGDLSTRDAGTFMEWLSFDKNKLPVLYLTVRARLMEPGRHGRVSVTFHSGLDGDGPRIEGTMRELLRATYLKPLRDAEAELSPGRGSRLAQILASYPQIGAENLDDFRPATPDEDMQRGTTLMGIMRQAEYGIKTNQSVSAARDNINTKYLSSLKVGSKPLISEIGVASDSSLQRILEKLELSIAAPDISLDRTRRGLGLNNVLFMAAELLLLGAREQYPLLLVEEPEAHLHPQLQSRVIELLKSTAQDLDNPVQVILTTHSPYLASTAPLSNITLICQGKTFSLTTEETMLEATDYKFLERFLDSTKANLFFAQAVSIVEGDAENLLLPALARKVGCCFSENGVSIVNVGHLGLFRYAKIFQRKNGQTIPVRVACITDFDLVPDLLDQDLKGSRTAWSDLSEEDRAKRRSGKCLQDGEPVQTFVSDSWTFEYDLAIASWNLAKIMHKAICCAQEVKRLENKALWPDPDSLANILEAAEDQVDDWIKRDADINEVALEIYMPLYRKHASKSVAAQFAAELVNGSQLQMHDLPRYLQQALQYLCPTGGNHDEADPT